MFKIYEFHWKAYNRFGQKLTGKQLAENREKVEKHLLQQGFSNIRIQRNFILPQKPKASEITQTIHQLAMLIGAKIPLKTALIMLLENSRNIKLYLWLQNIMQQLESGFILSIALKNHDGFLNAQEIQLIQMGEKSGTLAEMLATIAKNRQQSEQLAKKVKKIMFYPMMILAISLTLSVLMLLFIVPKFADLYSEKAQDLPLLTSILFHLSDFLQHNAYLMISSITIATLLCKFPPQKHRLLPHIKFHLLKLLPVFREIMSHSRLIFFCQNSGLMLKAHLRLDTVLESFCSAENGDLLLASEIQLTLERLKQGYSLSESLPHQLFPHDSLQMINVGEKSGQLSQMLLQISDIYRQKLDYQIDLLSQMLEPFLMLLIGMIVGTILVGLYLPIFDMGAMIE